MRKMIEYTVCFEEPVEKNDDLQVRANVVVLKNAGTSVVTLGDFWTLRPGETLNLGDSSGPLGVVRLEVKVRFAAGGTNQLQVMSMRAAGEFATVNYIDQP